MVATNVGNEVCCVGVGSEPKFIVYGGRSRETKSEF